MRNVENWDEKARLLVAGRVSHGQDRGHWEGEITNFRVQIRRELKVSPSLQRYLEAVMGECYGDARRVVARRAELPLEVLPERPIATVEDLLSLDWFPHC